MAAEILRDVPIDVYHAVPSEWVSHSRFHDFAKHGPAFFEKRYVTGEIAREETEALSYGQAFEDLKQRGIEAFREKVAVRPPHLKGKGNTASGNAVERRPRQQVPHRGRDVRRDGRDVRRAPMSAPMRLRCSSTQSSR